MASLFSEHVKDIQKGNQKFKKPTQIDNMLTYTIEASLHSILWLQILNTVLLWWYWLFLLLSVQSNKVSLRISRGKKRALLSKSGQQETTHISCFWSCPLPFEISSHAFYEKEEHVLLLGMKHTHIILVSEAMVATCPCCEGTSVPLSPLEFGRPRERCEVILRRAWQNPEPNS